MFWNVFDRWILLSWLGLFFVVAIWRVRLSLRFDRSPPATLEEVRYWRRRFAIGLRASVAGWALAATLFFPTNSGIHLVIYMLSMSGVTAGGAFSLAANRSNVRWHVIGITAAVAAQLSFNAIGADWGFVVMVNLMVIMYAGFLLSSAARYRTSMVERIRLQFENEALIQRLTTEKDRAENANHAKSTFLATMSHEIRTPLNGLIGLLQVFEDANLSGAQRSYLATMERSAGSLLQILNEILDYSKVETGKLELERLRFDWVDLAEDVARLMRSNADAKGLRFEMDIAAGEPRQVVGDPMRLRQIISNLLSNSIKFTKSGCVRFAVAGASDAAGDFRINIEVSDTGIGIPEAARQTIFSRFSQADSSMSRRYGGTGLGLAISQRLAELMDTRIEVESVEGAGSRFWLSPKLDAQGEDDRDLPSAHDLTRSRNTPLPSFQGRVLLVDDHGISRGVGALLLKKLGLACHLAESGAQAIETVMLRPWDIVFMDCQMPEMDGMEATRRIRECSNLPGGQPYIVACTANASAEDRRLCLAAGMDDFVSKPVKLEELAGALERWTQRRSEQPEAAETRR